MILQDHSGRKICESVRMLWVIHRVYYVFKNFENDLCEGDGSIVGRVCTVDCLEKGVMFAQSLLTGRMLEVTD